MTGQTERYQLDGVERTPNPCTCDCEGCRHHCSGHRVPDEASERPA